MITTFVSGQARAVSIPTTLPSSIQVCRTSGGAAGVGAAQPAGAAVGVEAEAPQARHEEHRRADALESLLAPARVEVGDLDVDVVALVERRDQIAGLVLGARVVRLGQQVDYPPAPHLRRGHRSAARSKTNSLQPWPPPTVWIVRNVNPRAVQNSKISSGVATSNG